MCRVLPSCGLVAAVVLVSVVDVVAILVLRAAQVFRAHNKCLHTWMNMHHTRPIVICWGVISTDLLIRTLTRLFKTYLSLPCLSSFSPLVFLLLILIMCTFLHPTLHVVLMFYTPLLVHVIKRPLDAPLPPSVLRTPGVGHLRRHSTKKWPGLHKLGGHITAVLIKTSQKAGSPPPPLPRCEATYLLSAGPFSIQRFDVHGILISHSWSFFLAIESRSDLAWIGRVLLRLDWWRGSKKKNRQEPGRLCTAQAHSDQVHRAS